MVDSNNPPGESDLEGWTDEVNEMTRRLGHLSDADIEAIGENRLTGFGEAARALRSAVEQRSGTPQPEDIDRWTDEMKRMAGELGLISGDALRAIHPDKLQAFHTAMSSLLVCHGHKCGTGTN